MSFPVGTIILTDQTTIPDKWHICDGGTYDGVTTPNLIGRFIRACNLDSQLKTTGGSDTHTHSPAAASTNGGGSHNHSNLSGSSAGPSGTFPSTGGSGGINFADGGHTHGIAISFVSASSHTHTMPALTAAANHIPQHISLCPIMRTKE